MKKKMLTGLQATGNLHIGNYLGAIKPFVNNQNEFENFIFVADLHAITVKQDPKVLKENIKKMLATYLACGIDPNKNTIYLQSDILGLPAISWLFECNTPYGELTRMTQFKDKSSKGEKFGAGLLTYPVLMAADILAIDADVVPVGVDQKQHLELARNIAEKFNREYLKNFFNLPEPIIKKQSAKIFDLLNPDKKMSKSAENKNGVIMLFDEEKVIRKKIMGAVTDSDAKVYFDEIKKPGISNLLTIYAEFAGVTIKQAEDKLKTSQYGEFKKAVADVVVSSLLEIQEKAKQFEGGDLVANILKQNAKKVNEIVNKKYQQMRQAMGLTF